ncbi:DUF4465 domain-containing protein [Limisalsivibrio acetivorans]|uniref:DUF4465 domain-containing protein n=1 Tax=Limisalsivibrio acetivorans TaxID=1304888 RepID=UPI0003B71A60|nr:DUF4465 domain-containing protein [Limisalsivibrio acetivorans]
MRVIASTLLIILCAVSAFASFTGFEDISLDNESYWNGSDGSGDLISNGIIFGNNYNADWMSWDGFACSNVTDNQTADWSNQYSAITGSGINASDNYGVAYNGYTEAPEITMPESGRVTGFFISNSTYAYNSMKHGDDFAKKFGGEIGEDPDWYAVTAVGYDETGTETGRTDFYLADYRGEDDYIVNNWRWFDLSELGSDVKTVEFEFASSDMGDFGMNTPAYFVLDNFNAKTEQISFEDTSTTAGSYKNGSDVSGEYISGNLRFANNYNADWMSWEGFALSSVDAPATKGYMNQYAAVTGGGVLSDTYAVAYSGYTAEPVITLPAEGSVSGLYITNTAYAFWSMLEGDDFAKKFGGETEDDPDWFKATFTGRDAEGNATGSVDVYLADYRFEESGDDYILRSWKWVDLSPLGDVKDVTVSFSGSDMGDFGLNTPAYAALDYINSAELSNSDLNGNGVSDDHEAPATADLDDDGTPDAFQDNALSTITNNGETITATALSGTLKSLSAEAVTERAAYTFATPSVSITAEGQQADINIYPENGLNGADTVFIRKATGWQEAEDGITASNYFGITAYDGGVYDTDGLENGEINLILAAGTVDEDTGTDDDTSSGGGGGGCSAGGGDSLGWLLLALSLGVITIRRKEQ